MTPTLAPQTDLDPMRTPAAAAAHRIAPGTAAPDGSGGTPALSARDIVLEYPDGERGVLRALDEVSLDLHAGTFTALVGPSGSGKSSLLAVAAAAQGLGLTLVVEGLALPQLRSGALVRALEPFCPAYEPLHIYFPGRRLVPPKLRAFLDFARTHAHLLPA